ncbi:MAG: hypothetical protein FWB88_06465 [Defluviitaleaceae bacterium]|nr:hypothetical protein [Defluviitaleaceae bacterium]MCL2239179.1 hypothetical protein [Defluviitaleaceae bacterium]
MKTYALLHHPMHQRIYKNAAARMALAELAALFPCAAPRPEVIGGVDYMAFDRAGPLTTEEIRVLSRASFTCAMFEYQKAEAPAPPYLIPLEKSPGYFMDESLSALLKYTGKTNELFTRLMLHLATEAAQPPLRILDPLAGKGTTLFEALIHGHHAHGVEIDPRYPAEAHQYLKKFLELARYKHTAHKDKVHSATRHKLTLARHKDAARTGDTRHFEIIQGDTRQAPLFYKKHFFDAIVADLPYGVQHASKDKKQPHGGGFTRNALGLLKEALPGWLGVLKPGGTMVLAWNLFLIPREEMEGLLTAHGLSLPETPDFSHRVDQAIQRDVIKACLTSALSPLPGLSRGGGNAPS